NGFGHDARRRRRYGPNRRLRYLSRTWRRLAGIIIGDDAANGGQNFLHRWVLWFCRLRRARSPALEHEIGPPCPRIRSEGRDRCSEITVPPPKFGCQPSCQNALLRVSPRPSRPLVTRSTSHRESSKQLCNV